MNVNNLSEDERLVEVERSTSTAHRLTNYDGACNHVHGHNMHWEVELVVSMKDVDEDNMPVDFKRVSDMIDDTDHAILLNEDDRLVQEFYGDWDENDDADWYLWRNDILGNTIVFRDGDPTCEYLTAWMTERLESLDTVERANVSCAETSKYTMTAPSQSG